jgi:putative flippase GtrA|tara:strand:+ start:113 stop:514 length:402 start_codon:yes stop_codon:yes gene_type:complete
VNFFIKLLNEIPKKFMIIGIINTIFGYLIGLLNYFIFYSKIGIIGVGFLNNIIAITFSFTLLKFFVFKTTNINWFLEYIRSYVVYGIQGLAGILILWVCVSFFNINIFFSQAISILTTVLLSYFGHKKFTFKV